MKLSRIILALLVVATLVVAFTTPRHPEASAGYARQATRSETAYAMAASFIKERLPAPTQATFARLGDVDTGVLALGEERFRAWGYVDSPGGAEGTRRDPWVAEVEDMGQNRWQPRRLTLGGENLSL